MAPGSSREWIWSHPTLPPPAPARMALLWSRSLETERHVDSVVAWIGPGLRLRTAQIVEQALFANAPQKSIGILRVVGPPFLHRPDALHLGLAIEAQPGDRQLAH